MKQKDITLIVVVTVVSAIVSLLISNSFIAPPKHRQQQVEKVSPISSDFPQPDPTYFNSNSIDPTQLITIGGNSNTQPFNGQ